LAIIFETKTKYHSRQLWCYLFYSSGWVYI